MRPHQKTGSNTAQLRPYTRMLGQYQLSAEKLLHRLDILKTELREMQLNKRGTPESALAQKKLETRIMLLRTEFYELTDCIREIRFYAEREKQ